MCEANPANCSTYHGLINYNGTLLHHMSIHFPIEVIEGFIQIVDMYFSNESGDWKYGHTH